MKKKLFLMIIIQSITLVSFAQINSKEVFRDSLVNKSFYQLQTRIFDENTSQKNKKEYVDYYLKKAKKEEDSIQIGTAYLFMTATKEGKANFETYVDSSIYYTDKKTSFFVPCTAYSMKAGIYFEKKNFKKALDYYILTHDAAIKGGNIELSYIAKYMIGTLKKRIGQSEEALEYMKDCWNFIERNGASKSFQLNTLFALSSAYADSKKLDSASIISNIGQKKATFFKDTMHYYRFTLVEGVNQFMKKNYSATIDSLQKALPYLNKDNDTTNVAVSYYYLGRSYKQLENIDFAIEYLQKLDSIFVISKGLLPSCRNGYKILIDYYEKKNDYQKQLYYTNQLLELDSILNSNYQYLSSTIYNKHETPLLVNRKQLLIDSLNKDKKYYTYFLYIFIPITIVIAFGFVFNYYKRKKEKKKFDELIKKLDEQKEYKNNKDSDQEIQSEIVAEVLKKLEKFEEEKGFINKKNTVGSLSKKLGTNSKYLSKIINSYKDKSFTNYINDLRIDYIIDKLRQEKKFLNFTVDALAKEAGFGNPKSFSKAFHKKTGIYPSYFIKELKKNLNI